MKLSKLPMIFLSSTTLLTSGNLTLAASELCNNENWHQYVSAIFGTELACDAELTEINVQLEKIEIEYYESKYPDSKYRQNYSNSQAISSANRSDHPGAVATDKFGIIQKIGQESSGSNIPTQKIDLPMVKGYGNL